MLQKTIWQKSMDLSLALEQDGVVLFTTIASGVISPCSGICSWYCSITVLSTILAYPTCSQTIAPLQVTRWFAKPDQFIFRARHHYLRLSVKAACLTGVVYISVMFQSRNYHWDTISKKCMLGGFIQTARSPRICKETHIRRLLISLGILIVVLFLFFWSVLFVDYRHRYLSSHDIYSCRSKYSPGMVISIIASFALGWQASMIGYISHWLGFEICFYPLYFLVRFWIMILFQRSFSRYSLQYIEPVDKRGAGHVWNILITFETKLIQNMPWIWLNFANEHRYDILSLL